MQVTDHRSQVQVRVKASRSPCLGKKKNKIKLKVSPNPNHNLKQSLSLRENCLFQLFINRAVTSLALVTCDLCFVPATKLTNSSIATANPKFCVSFPAKAPPQLCRRLVIQPNKLRTKNLTLFTLFVNIFLFLFDPEYWNCCQQTL